MTNETWELQRLSGGRMVLAKTSPHTTTTTTTEHKSNLVWIAAITALVSVVWFAVF